MVRRDPAPQPGQPPQTNAAVPPGGNALPGLPPGQRQPRGTPQTPASLQPGDELLPRRDRRDRVEERRDLDRVEFAVDRLDGEQAQRLADGKNSYILTARTSIDVGLQRAAVQ